jgi:uncharacterized membrane protein YfcA
MHTAFAFDGFPPLTLVLLALILGCSAVMSGLSGFGFSAIGALCLTLVPPKMGVPLLMSLSSANQLLSLGQLKTDLKPIREWWPDGPAPYLLGGLLGVPIGLVILSAMPTANLMLVFGGFLVLYAAYSLLKPAGASVSINNWMASSAVGLTGGVIGGFTAFPGAPVVVWSGLRHLPKRESRSIVQPFIFGMQILSLTLLAIQRPQTFGGTFWVLLAITIPIVLLGTLIGVRLYRSLSDVNFRRVTFMLLAISGLGLLAKATSSLHLLGHAGGH